MSGFHGCLEISCELTQKQTNCSNHLKILGVFCIFQLDTLNELFEKSDGSWLIEETFILCIVQVMPFDRKKCASIDHFQSNIETIYDRWWSCSLAT